MSDAITPQLPQLQVKISVSGGTTPVDATLTKSGEAADAKAVGDALKAVPEGATLIAEVDGAFYRVKSEGVGGMPEGGVPHQHLVTDVDGVAKWKEKPFYEGSPTVLLPHTVATFTDNEGQYWNVDTLPSFSLELGKTYTVVWDGVEYECVGWDGGHGAVALGNGVLMGYDNMADDRFPFGIFVYNGKTTCAAADTNEHTLYACVPGEVKTIDPKYLPGDILVIHANFVLPEDFDVLKQHFECEGTYDRPWQEVLDAVMNNKLCLLQATVRLANGDMYIYTTIDFDAVSWTEEHEICSVEFRKTIGVPVTEGSGLKLYFNTLTCSVFSAESEFPEYAFLCMEVNRVSAEEAS